MIINQEILDWLKEQPITNNRGIAFAKGLYKVPANLSDIKKFIKFTRKFGQYYK